MNNLTPNTPLTYESLMASIHESNRYLSEGFAETRQLFAETDKKFDRLERMIDKDRELIGGISRSNGEFCEEYFINSFKEKPVFLGEKFDRVLPFLRPDPVVIEDEYDLVLRNGKSVVLIEMRGSY